MKKTVALLAAGMMALSLNAANDAVRRLDASAMALDEIMKTPDKGIPEDLFSKAACAVIVPGLKKGAFIVGDKVGRGFIMCRKLGGGWSAPAAVKMEGGSVNGSAADVVLLLMNQNGVDKLLRRKFTVGADGSAAIGPVGRTSSAASDAQMHADILSWSRSLGAFLGLSLEGATLRPDEDSNSELYNKPVTNREIVTGGVEPPAAAAKLLEELNRYSGHRCPPHCT